MIIPLNLIFTAEIKEKEELSSQIEEVVKEVEEKKSNTSKIMDLLGVQFSRDSSN